MSSPKPGSPSSEAPGDEGDSLSRRMRAIGDAEDDAKADPTALAQMREQLVQTSDDEVAEQVELRFDFRDHAPLELMRDSHLFRRLAEGELRARRARASAVPAAPQGTTAERKG